MADIKNIDRIKELAASKEISELLMSNEKEYIFAACFKACEKQLGITPYDEQLYAAYELSNGNIIEMKTGECKTLSAVFAA